MANQTCNPSVITQALGITATGPRTVIVPADPIMWDGETSYEYLTLVASADFGQGYIAKKDVPAGTPLTNTDYWIPVASYNAQLAAILARLNGFAKKFASVADMVEDTSANVGDLCVTSGYSTSGDGGGATYVAVTQTEGADGWSVISGNGVDYQLVVEDKLDFRCTGATNTGDVTAKFNQAVSYCVDKGITLFIPSGTWNLTPVTLPNYASIVGESASYATQKDSTHFDGDTVLNFTPTANTGCITCGYAASLRNLVIVCNAVAVSVDRESLVPLPDQIMGNYGGWFSSTTTVEGVTGIDLADNSLYAENIQVIGAYTGFDLTIMCILKSCMANRCYLGYRMTSDVFLNECFATECTIGAATTENNNKIDLRVDGIYQYGINLSGMNNDVSIVGDFVGENLVHVMGFDSLIRATSKRFSVNHAVTSADTVAQCAGLVLIDGDNADNNLIFATVGQETTFGRWMSAHQVAMFVNSDNVTNHFITNLSVKDFTPGTFTYNNLTSIIGRINSGNKASFTMRCANCDVYATNGTYYGFSDSAYKVSPSA